METFFGFRFLKSEYVITAGRMDSIGNDENNSSVIFEYKRSSSENVINQGLFYLDWLLDHKADFIESLGDDLTQNQLKMYLAYKKVQNVFCIEIYKQQIIVRMKLNPDTVELENGFTRDMRNIGHYGTGNLEVSIKTEEDFMKVKPLISLISSMIPTENTVLV